MAGFSGKLAGFSGKLGIILVLAWDISSLQSEIIRSSSRLHSRLESGLNPGVDFSDLESENALSGKWEESLFVDSVGIRSTDGFSGEERRTVREHAGELKNADRYERAEKPQNEEKGEEQSRVPREEAHAINFIEKSVESPVQYGEDDVTDGDTISVPEDGEVPPGAFATNFACNETFNMLAKGLLCTGSSLPGSGTTESWRACNMLCATTNLCVNYTFRELDKSCNLLNDGSCYQRVDGYVTGDGNSAIHDCTSCNFSLWAEWNYPCIPKNTVHNLLPATISTESVKWRTRSITGYPYNKKPFSGDACYTVQSLPCDGTGPTEATDSADTLMVTVAAGGVLVVVLVGVYGYQNYTSAGADPGPPDPRPADHNQSPHYADYAPIYPPPTAQPPRMY